MARGGADRTPAARRGCNIASRARQRFFTCKPPPWHLKKEVGNPRIQFFIADLRQRGGITRPKEVRTGHSHSPARGIASRVGQGFFTPTTPPWPRTPLPGAAAAGLRGFSLSGRVTKEFSVLRARGDAYQVGTAVPPLRATSSVFATTTEPAASPSLVSLHIPHLHARMGGRETRATEPPSHRRVVAVVQRCPQGLAGRWLIAEVRARTASPWRCRNPRAPTAGTRRWGAPRGCCAST